MLNRRNRPCLRWKLLPSSNCWIESWFWRISSNRRGATSTRFRISSKRFWLRWAARTCKILERRFRCRWLNGFHLVSGSPTKSTVTSSGTWPRCWNYTTLCWRNWKIVTWKPAGSSVWDTFSSRWRRRWRMCTPITAATIPGLSAYLKIISKKIFTKKLKKLNKTENN